MISTRTALMASISSFELGAETWSTLKNGVCEVTGCGTTDFDCFLFAL